MQFIIFLCRFQVWNCVGRCNLMKFHAFLCRFQVWNCIDRCNVSHVYAILKCETLSFDVIWNKMILLWVHALFRDPLRGGRGNFTEIKFNQIRSRCDKFGDFLAKILRFEGFSRFSLSCGGGTTREMVGFEKRNTKNGRIWSEKRENEAPDDDNPQSMHDNRLTIGWQFHDNRNVL